MLRVVLFVGFSCLLCYPIAAQIDNNASTDIIWCIEGSDEYCERTPLDKYGQWYHPVGEYTFSLDGIDERDLLWDGMDVERRGKATPRTEKLIDRALEKLVTAIEHHTERGYHDLSLIQELKNQRIGTSACKGSDRRDVYLVKLELIRDKHHGILRAHGRASVRARTVPDRIFDPAIDVLQERLDQLNPRQAASLSDQGYRANIDLNDLRDLALNDPDFLDALKDAVSDYMRQSDMSACLFLADDGSRDFLERLREGMSIQGFKSGQYDIPELMDRLLERTVLNALRIAVEEAGDEPVNIICIGHTDNSPVRGKIPYKGGAKLDTPISTPVTYRPSGSIEIQYINNNLELSLARAWAGAATLHSMLQKRRNLVRRVRFSYQGEGDLQATSNKAGSRRIEYRIQ